MKQLWRRAKRPVERWSKLLLSNKFLTIPGDLADGVVCKYCSKEFKYA